MNIERLKNYPKAEEVFYKWAVDKLNTPNARTLIEAWNNNNILNGAVEKILTEFFDEQGIYLNGTTNYSFWHSIGNGRIVTMFNEPPNLTFGYIIQTIEKNYKDTNYFSRQQAFDFGIEKCFEILEGKK